MDDCNSWSPLPLVLVIHPVHTPEMVHVSRQIENIPPFLLPCCCIVVIVHMHGFRVLAETLFFERLRD